MRIIVCLVSTLAILVAAPVRAAETPRFVSKVKLPSGQTAVIAEGEFEARSIGSFSIRLYDAATGDDETTFFASGLVSPRDGTVEQVTLADLDEDRSPEIIVKVRSAGSGGYLSAAAYRVTGKQIALASTVEGLAPGADTVAALKKSIIK